MWLHSRHNQGLSPALPLHSRPSPPRPCQPNLLLASKPRLAVVPPSLLDGHPRHRIRKTRSSNPPRAHHPHSNNHEVIQGGLHLLDLLMTFNSQDQRFPLRHTSCLGSAL